jgi:hypothetical protein
MARLRGNWRAPRGHGGGAVREGRALLQGLPCCGRCGRIMQTGYSGTTGNCPRYVCSRAKQLYGGEHVCQSIGGGRLEKTVLDKMFAVLEPAALTATAQALSEAEAHYRQRLAAFETAVERARYEADRARRQYDAVEPENRLVARTLERALEDKLAAVRRAETNWPPNVPADQSRSPRRRSRSSTGPAPTCGASSTPRPPASANASSSSGPSLPRSASPSTVNTEPPSCGSCGKAVRSPSYRCP